MKEIRRYIRNIILESISGPGSFSINPKIKSFCDTVLSAGNPIIKVGKKGVKYFISINLGKEIAVLEFKPTTQGEGNCSGAMSVKWTTSSPEFPGAALICYELAIEMLGQPDFNSGLISDRVEVSHPMWNLSPVYLNTEKHGDKGFAYDIWKVYAKRPDVKKSLLDPLGFYFTPDESDDCDAGSAFALWTLERNQDYQQFIKQKRSKKELIDFGFSFRDDEEAKQRAKQDPLWSIARSSKRGNRRAGFNSIIQNNPELLAKIESEWKAYGIPLMIMYSKDSLPTWEYLVSKGAKIDSVKIPKIISALGSLLKPKPVENIGIITDLPDGFVP